MNLTHNTSTWREILHSDYVGVAYRNFVIRLNNKAALSFLMPEAVTAIPAINESKTFNHLN